MKVCLACRRHVLPQDADCPFCGASVPTVTGRGGLGVALGVAMAACGPSVGDGGGGSSSGSSTGTPGTTSAGVTTATATVASTTSTSVGTGSDSTGLADDAGDGCGGFYGSFCADWGLQPGDDCDVDVQDCPEGERCVPWSDDGGPLWNATKCSPLGDMPGQYGEPCTVEGSPVSGIDSCDAGLMCFGVDPDTNTGTCIELCDVEAQLCDLEGTVCAIQPGGAMGVCLLPCDPLDPMCGNGQGCYAFDEGVMGCAPDGSGDDGVYADPCTYQTDCDPGLACVAGNHVPACDGVHDDCCTELCDPEAMQTCPDEAQGQSCTAISNTPTVGACL